MNNIPKPLRAGDTVGIISVTGPAEKERFDRGVQHLHDLGFKTRVALTPTTGYGRNDFLFGSDTPRNRAQGLHELFAAPEVKAILATRGGYGAMEILPYLDDRIISANPKPVIGFSDVTALLIALSQKCGCPVIHGPVLEFGFARAGGGDTQSAEGVSALVKLLKGEELNPFKQETLRYLGKVGDCSGRVVGGNLSILAAMMGTPWQPQIKDRLIFIEDVSEPPYRIHRYLLQLKLAGFFTQAAGVLLGDFTKCEHPKQLGPGLEETIADIFSDVSIPVLTGLPCGHAKRNLPLPFTEMRISQGKVHIP